MPNELHREPTAMERALEDEIDALLRVQILLVRKLEETRQDRDVARAVVTELRVALRDRDMELKDMRQAVDNAVETNGVLDALIKRMGGYAVAEALAGWASEVQDAVASALEDDDAVKQDGDA